MKLLLLTRFSMICQHIHSHPASRPLTRSRSIAGIPQKRELRQCPSKLPHEYFAV
jgi:hypothetical protein